MQNISNNITNIVILITSIPSIISTILVFYKFILNPQFFKNQLFIIFNLCLNDFIQAASIGIPVILYFIHHQIPYTGSCQLQGFFQLFSCLGQFIWTFNIAYSVYTSLSTHTQQTKQIKIYIISYGIPLIISIIPIISHQYSLTNVGNTVCFIKSPQYTLYLFVIPIMYYLFDSIIQFCIYFKPFVINYSIQYITQISQTRNSQSIIQTYVVSFNTLILLRMVYYLFYKWFNYQIWCIAMSNLTGLFDYLAYGFNSILNNFNLSQSNSNSDDNDNQQEQWICQQFIDLPQTIQI